MKRKSTLLLFITLLFASNILFAKSPELRGLSETIASLDSSYCNNEANALIIPDALDSRTLYVEWKVSYALGAPDQPSLYTLTGSGRNVVLHFNPNAVPSMYYGQKIYFRYTESDDDAVYGSKSDNTRVFPVPTPYNFANDTTICPGGTATLRLLDSESDMRYILFKNGARTATIQNGTGSLISFPVTTVGTYSLKAQNVNDTTCMVDMSNTVNVSMFPIVNPTLTGSTSVCIGTTDVTYTTDAGQSAYVWDVDASGGLITNGLGTNQIKVIWHTSGPHYIKVNYTKSNTCSALTPTNRVVNVHPLPIPTITGDSVPCISATKNYTTEGGMSNYVWTLDGGTITAGATTNTVSVLWTALGKHKISVNYKDTYGCTANSAIDYDIRVADRPVPTISGAVSACQGTTGVIYQTETGKANYAWSIPAGGTITAGAGTNQITVTWTSAGSRTVNVNYENIDGCPAILNTTYPVTVLPLPVPTITGKDTICLGQLGTIYTTESGKSAYSWTIPTGGTIVSGANTYQGIVNWTTAGYPQTIRVSYQGSNGCFAATPTTKNVIVSELPIPTLSGPDSVCAGYPDVSYTTEASKNNYIWTITSGGTITSGSLSNQAQVSWLTPGDNTMTVNYKNNYGCTATAPVSKNTYVKVSPTPTISSVENSFCLDTAAVKVYNTQNGMQNYVWNVSSGGTIISGQSTSSISVKWSTSGAKTVSVNYSLANGCLAPNPATYNVTVKPSPVPTISGVTTACDGTTYKYFTETGMSNYSWNIVAPDVITSGSGTDTVYVTWNTVGPHTIEINYSNTDGCYALAPTVENITVLAAPSPSFTVAPATACEGNVKTYTTQASMFNYTWNVPTGGTIQSGQGTNSINVLWNTAGPHTVTINYQNGNGCIAPSPASTAVTVYSTPTPTITGNDTVCVNSTSNYSTEQSMSNYLWTVTGGTIMSGQGTYTVSVQWNLVGKRSIQVNYENADGCPAQTATNLDVEVSALPVPTITGNKTVCTGFATTYTTQSGMNNYNWSISGGGTITSGGGTDAITVNWTTAGKRAVKISYLTPAGCAPVAQTIDTVTVSASPVPSITGAIAACEGATSVAYSTTTGQLNYDWQISSGGTIMSGAGTNAILVNWNTPGPQIISSNYENAGGCSASSPTIKNVNVVAKPTPTITGIINSCTADTVGYKTESGMNTYVWTVSAGGTLLSGQGTDSITVLWNNTGSESISVTYKNSTGCAPAALTTQIIAVGIPATPSISGSQALCAGVTTSYTTEKGMNNYIWSVSAGGTLVSGAGTDSITVLWNTAGARSVSVNYYNAAGCNATINKTLPVTIYVAPTPPLNGITTVCEGTSNVQYTTTTGMTNYVWNVTGGTITSGAGTDKIQVTWNTPGTQTISVNFQNAGGCSAASPTSKNINVVAKPLPTISGLFSSCPSNTVGYKTESGMNTYVWTVSAGGTLLSGQGTDSITVLWNNTGSESISVTYKNSTGCSPIAAKTQAITIGTRPNPTLTGLQALCAGVTTSYTTEKGMNNYIWSVSTGGTLVSGAGTDSITVLWNTAGARSVSVNYDNAAGCNATINKTLPVTIYVAPTPPLNGITTVCEGTSNVQYTTTTGMTNYVWNVTGGTITSGAGTDKIQVTWNTPGTQTISVNFQNAGGCSAASPTSKNINVVAKPLPTISGLFSSCPSNTVGYKTESGMNTYVWTVSAGGTLLSGQGTDSITVLWNNTGSESISVTYKNSTGCSPIAAKTQAITIGSRPNPTLTGLQALCAGVTTSYTTEKGMNNYIWSVSAGGTLVSGAGTDSIRVLWNTAGARTVTVNYDNTDGCNASTNKTIAVTVYNAPAPTISGSLTVCEGATNVSYTTTAGMNNYVWNVTGGTITSGAGTDKIQVDWTTIGNQTITLNYQNLGGCSAATPSSRTVNVVAKPVPSITGSASVCQNETITYTTEAGMNTYDWDISTGGTIISGENTNTVQVKWSTAVAHTISVSYKNSTGCAAAAATIKNITVNAIPSPSINGLATVCQNQTGVTYTTESGMSNYTWTISGGTITAGLGTNAVTVTWNTVGKNPIRVNYSNAAGCYADTATVDSILVNPITIPSITGPSPVCEGATSVVYETEIGLNNYNWTISGGGAIVSGQGTYQLTVNWNTIGAQSLTATFKNEFGCQAATPTSKAISVIAKPVPTITGATTACLNQNTTYTTEAGMSNYQWTLSPGYTIIAGSGTSTLVVRWTSSGAKTVSVNYTIPGNCTADAPTNFNLTVNTPPSPTLTGPDTVCANGGAYAFTTDAGMSNYTWSNTGLGTLVSGTGTNVANFAWNTTGNKIVYINYRDANGCLAASPSSKAVYAKAAPVPTITGIKTLCQGSTGIKYYTENNQNTYTWAVSSGGTIVSGQGTDTIYVDWTGAGKQTVSINYKNSIGCQAASATVDTVTVNALPIPKITANNNGCIGSNTTISTDAGMSNYVWTVSPGGSIISGQGTRQIVVSWSTTGNETVSITYTNTNLCNPVAPTTKVFTVSAIPVVTVAVDKNPICAGTNVSFTASGDLAMSNYKYYINTNSINNGSNPVYSSSALVNNDNVYVVGTSTNGCLGTSNTIQMIVFDIPTAALAVSPNTSIISGTNTTFTASGTGLYQFYLNGSIVQAYSSNDTYANSLLSNNDVVSLKVKNGNDCYDSTAVTITVLDTIIKKNIIASATDYCVSSNGVSIILNNPQAGIIYKLYRTNDNVDLGSGTISASSIVWNNIKTGINGTREFKVIAYYAAFPSNIVEMSNRLDITQVPLPSIFFVSPTGTQTNCNAGAGFEVKLSGSETGVKYYLYRNGSATGNSLIGTGSNLSFGNQVVSGTYTVVAENTTATTCKTNMTGSFTINTATQTIFDLSSNPANGHYCAGTSGVVLNQNGSTNGVSYLLYRDGTNYVKTVLGNGNAISFGSVTTEGVYTVVVNESGCLTSMNGAVTVIKDQLPTAYSLIATNNGTYCEGTLGVNISLANQELGVEYQLLLNGIAEGSPITGSIAGAAFDFPGNYITEGVYSVKATTTDAGCISTSTNTITVDKTMTPLDIAISGDTTFCNGGSAKINIASTESDVMYKLLKDGVETGDASLGNGGLLTFNVTTNGTYKVLAQRIAGGISCPLELTDSIVITKTIDPDIKAYTWVDGTGCTQGTVITIIQTQNGVNYTLYNRANNLAVSNSTLIGDGSDLSFPEIVDSNGNYYIVAKNGSCGLEFTNPGDVNVAIAGVAQKQEVSIPSTICADMPSVTIGLKTTETGVSYDLYLAAGDIKVSTTPIIGDGTAKSFASVSTQGTYYVIASFGGCDVEMLNRVDVVFNKLPNAYTLSGNGYYCPSMNGTTLNIDSTETGINYSLQIKTGASWNTEAQIIGSGNAISFNNVLTVGDYRVLAVTDKGCETIMKDTITVVSKSTPTAYAVSVDNSNYCNNVATGAELYLAGTEKDVTYFIVNISTNDTVTYSATADSSNPVNIATIPEGFYQVSAAWLGSACNVSLTPTPVEVAKLSLPINTFTFVLDAIVICNADSTYLRVPDAQNGVLYDIEKDGVMLNLPLDRANGEVKWEISGNANSFTSYKVYAYVAGFKPCGFYADNTETLETRVKPNSYNLSPSIASLCMGDLSSTITINVSNAQSSLIYELFDASNTLIDTYIPSVNGAFSFVKGVSPGVYNVSAKYNVGNCSAAMNNITTVSEDDSSLVCFPFEAITDVLYLPKGESSSKFSVSKQADGGNDILSSVVDLNLEYKLITTWTNASGKVVSTNGIVAFEDNTTDLFTYTKTSNFYGKDSVIYEITNLDHKNRKDTAIIYIFVGNEEIVDGVTILIPNAFSPNGDNKNDYFIIEGIDGLISSELQVFNRWGALVYRSTGDNYDNRFDGNANSGVSIGEELPVGTYFYLYNASFNATGSVQNKKFSGFIELRR